MHSPIPAAQLHSIAWWRQVHGTPFKYFNLISTRRLSLNAQFLPVTEGFVGAEGKLGDFTDTVLGTLHLALCAADGSGPSARLCGGGEPGGKFASTAPQPRWGARFASLSLDGLRRTVLAKSAAARGIIFVVGVWNMLFFLGLVGVPTGVGTTPFA